MQSSNFEIEQAVLDAYKDIKMKSKHRYVICKPEGQSKVAEW